MIPRVQDDTCTNIKKTTKIFTIKLSLSIMITLSTAWLLLSKSFKEIPEYQYKHLVF